MSYLARYLYVELMPLAIVDINSATQYGGIARSITVRVSDHYIAINYLHSYVINAFSFLMLCIQ